MKTTALVIFVSLTGFSSHGALVITEVMSNSAHPGGPANGDWFEITNTGAAAIDLTGYYWDDDGPAANDGSLFPAITLNPMSSLVIVNENASNLPGFLSAWGNGFNAVSKDDFGGPDDFSSLSASGDQIEIWDADPNTSPANLVASVTFGASADGFSFEWARDRNFLGQSAADANGAFLANNDGDGGSGLDTGSPGLSVVPEPSVGILASLGFLALLRRRR